MDVSSNKEIRDLLYDKWIRIGIGNIEGRSVCGGKVPPLKQKFHDEVCTIIPTGIPDGIDVRDIIIKRVSVIKELVVSLKDIRGMDVDKGRVGHDDRIGEFIEGLAEIMIEGWLGFLQPHGIMVPGA